MSGEDGAPLRLIAVVAMASNRVIGKDGGLPWHLPEDLKFFKQLTTGGTIVMGRKTYESIGRPLPKRRNIVLSRSLKTAPEGCELAADLSDLELNGDVFIIGGAQIYAALLDQIDEIIMTYVFDAYDGDTLLPEFEDGFEMKEVLALTPEFEVRRYTRK
jgi:dihydrofolate reductase